MDERRRIEDPPTISDVAQKIVGDGSVPDWLVRALEHFSDLVGHSDKGNTVVEKRMLEAARYLEEWLPMYVRLEERFGFEQPDWIDELSTALYQAIEFLEDETRPLGKQPDARFVVCALVVSRAYELVHGKRSAALGLGEACELYWQACGNEQRGEYGEPLNWRRDLERAKAEPDPWPLDMLAAFRAGGCT
jgi:hypothetical protein